MLLRGSRACALTTVVHAAEPELDAIWRDEPINLSAPVVVMLAESKQALEKMQRCWAEQQTWLRHYAQLA